MAQAEKQLICAYGDRREDGMDQLSVALPVPLSERAKEAARRFVSQMGLTDVKVHSAEAAADHFTFFVVYARSQAAVDFGAIDVPELVVRKMGFDELNGFIKEEVVRRIVVYGACNGKG